MTNTMNQCENKINSKIIIVGDCGVGKTSLMYRFCNGVYTDDQVTTISPGLSSRSLKSDNKIVSMTIWDTAGQEKYFSITKSLFRNIHGVLFVYDVTRETTLFNMERWFKIVQEEAPPDIVRVLVGHKCDNVKQISTEEGKRIADYYGMPFIEASSKSNINVDAIFDLTAEMVVRQLSMNPLSENQSDGITLTNENSQIKESCYFNQVINDLRDVQFFSCDR